MDYLISLSTFVQAHSSESFALLFAISELLAYVPALEGNGMFQVIHKFLAARVKKNG